jgi:hypothetical protein
MAEKYREYVKARNAEEAIKLSHRIPVSEVNEMTDKPQTQNGDGTLAPCIGFQMIQPEED